MLMILIGASADCGRGAAPGLPREMLVVPQFAIYRVFLELRDRRR